MSTVAIVGAGPAGLHAAATLADAGLRPVLIDEAPRIGGQIYRQPPPARQRLPRALYGFEAGKATALFERFAALQGRIDHRPATLVWQIEGRSLHLLHDGRADRLRFDALILATGAAERVLPFPGWTLPGVFTLGAAQVALKAQATPSSVKGSGLPGEPASRTSSGRVVIAAPPAPCPGRTAGPAAASPPPSGRR